MKLKIDNNEKVILTEDSKDFEMKTKNAGKWSLHVWLSDTANSMPRQKRLSIRVIGDTGTRKEKQSSIKDWNSLREWGKHAEAIEKEIRPEFEALVKKIDQMYEKYLGKDNIAD